jgi:hypothetical protein
MQYVIDDLFTSYSHNMKVQKPYQTNYFMRPRVMTSLKHKKDFLNLTNSEEAAFDTLESRRRKNHPVFFYGFYLLKARLTSSFLMLSTQGGFTDTQTPTEDLICNKYGSYRPGINSDEVRYLLADPHG